MFLEGRYLHTGSIGALVELTTTSRKAAETIVSSVKDLRNVVQTYLLRSDSHQDTEHKTHQIEAACLQASQAIQDFAFITELESRLADERYRQLELRSSE